MAEEKDEKPCRACGEPIRRRAQKCPHCHSVQALWKDVSIVIAILITIAIVTLLNQMHNNIFAKKADLADSNYREKLVIIESKMHFSQSEKGSFVSVVGRLKNNTNIPWKYPCIQAQFFNSSGDLVDSVSDNGYGLIIPPHSEASFRVRGEADKGKDQYIKHKVVLLWAEEERSLF